MDTNNHPNENGLPRGALPALERYFAEHGLLAPAGSLRATLLDGGRSNLSYGLTDGVSEWVLRTPPRGGVAPTAHDVAREYRVMSTLAETPVPVPRMVALCESPDLLGVPFVLMERVRGQIWRAPADAAGASAEDRRRACEALVDTLAALHAVDHARLHPLVRGDGRGYLRRQLERWSGQWVLWNSRDVPEVERLRDRLVDCLPTSAALSVVHGDYRFDNVILDATGSGTIRAVLDWELSTIGDPLADLGSLVAFWGEPEVEPVLPHQALTCLPGFLSASEVVERYRERTGRAVDDLGVYVAFGCFRWAVIREGIRARSLINHVDVDVEAISASVPVIAARGIAVMGEEPPL